MHEEHSAETLFNFSVCLSGITKPGIFKLFMSNPRNYLNKQKTRPHNFRNTKIPHVVHSLNYKYTFPYFIRSFMKFTKFYDCLLFYVSFSVSRLFAYEILYQVCIHFIANANKMFMLKNM